MDHQKVIGGFIGKKFPAGRKIIWKGLLRIISLI